MNQPEPSPQSRNEPEAGHGSPLSQPEGLNAGSASASREDGSDRSPARRDQTDGPHADHEAPSFTMDGEPVDEPASDRAGGDELAGAPGADPREPSAEHGASGQDSGSME